MSIHVSRYLKEKQTWATDQWLEFINIIITIMLFKTVIPLRNYRLQPFN